MFSTLDYFKGKNENKTITYELKSKTVVLVMPIHQKGQHKIRIIKEREPLCTQSPSKVPKVLIFVARSVLCKLIYKQTLTPKISHNLKIIKITVSILFFSFIFLS